MDELEELGLSKNTIVIFASDNGYYKGARGFAGKWSHYEESLRIPLIIFDPRADRMSRGRVVDAMALNIDIPATILGYSGVQPPASYQGHSLVPVMNAGVPASWRKDFFCEHLMNHEDIPKYEGVHGQRYVYARYFEQNPVYEYLHDLQQDPDQLTNFADDPEYATVLGEMRSRCDQLRDSYGGVYKTPLPKKTPAPKRGSSSSKELVEYAAIVTLTPNSPQGRVSNGLHRKIRRQCHGRLQQNNVRVHETTGSQPVLQETSGRHPTA